MNTNQLTQSLDRLPSFLIVIIGFCLGGAFGALAYALTVALGV